MNFFEEKEGEKEMKKRFLKTKGTLLKTIGGLALAISLLTIFATQKAWTNQNGIALAAGPAESCSVGTLRGSYLFAAHGFNIVGGVAQPKAIVEGIDFNGDGTLVSPFATVSINGNIIHPPGGGVGSYTVDADCTGTLTFTAGPSFDIFVEPSGGKQLWMIQTGPAAVPAVFEGTATKVSP
jgi:hypothetical protein